jgi:hypothetical protein
MTFVTTIQNQDQRISLTVRTARLEEADHFLDRSPRFSSFADRLLFLVIECIAKVQSKGVIHV